MYNLDVFKSGSARPTTIAPFKRDLFNSTIDDVFNHFYDSFFSSEKELGVIGTFPKMDVLSKKDEFIINMACPGIPKEDLNVSLDKDVNGSNRLTVSGQYQSVDNQEKPYVLLKELKHSAFTRSIVLSDNINTETIDVTMKDGILRIAFKYKEGTKVEETTKRIPIK